MSPITTCYFLSLTIRQIKKLLTYAALTIDRGVCKEEAPPSCKTNSCCPELEFKTVCFLRNHRNEVHVAARMPPQRDQLKTWCTIFASTRRRRKKRRGRKQRIFMSWSRWLWWRWAEEARKMFAASALPISDPGATQQTVMYHTKYMMAANTLLHFQKQASSVQKHTRKSFLSWRVELKACHFNYPSNFPLNCTLYVDPLEGPPTQLAWFVGST